MKMEIGTTNRWAALLLLAGLIGAAFAINGFQARQENAGMQSAGAAPASPVTQESSKFPPCCHSLACGEGAERRCLVEKSLSRRPAVYV
jgi:hypothetical protein